MSWGSKLLASAAAPSGEVGAFMEEGR
jgi:hypothetical protein